MGRGLVSINWIVQYFIMIAGLLVTGPSVALAGEMVCARVKIEIKQELTLERQGFDAHMRINHGLADITLENVKVEVSFADEQGDPVLASSDPANTDALFFIRLDTDALENIDDVEGNGTVEPSTSADIHWLIIPARGSSNGLEKGTLYYVGAKLTYTIGGQQKVTEVTPDYIFVKPLPEITLNYFLPSDVYGDDAFTDETEPSIPFSLGVRVSNSGKGVAKSLKIDSAQPKIVGNEQGLLIGFAIEGSEVNGQPATDSLLANFGDIAPDSARAARWIMTCTMSGKFLDFDADFSHSDKLGGQLTSLIIATRHHFLVHDVLVDLPGRDTVRDFLAKDDSQLRLYESEFGATGSPEEIDSEVTDQSALANLQTDSNPLTLTTPVTAGFMYVKLADPFDGNKVLTDVIRSDGKVIKAENAWLSKTRDINHNWQYFINLFDANTIGTYTVRFNEAPSKPLPPELFFIPDRWVSEKHQTSFMVEATDPQGTFPALSAAPLPVGAEFVDTGDGRAIFNWTPAKGQAGQYEIRFIATDGVLTAARRATLTVASFSDTDGDGLPDSWEMGHFGDLEQNKKGDFDDDGTTNWQEYQNGTDPAASNAPGIPEIYVPADGTEVTALGPELMIGNSVDPDGDPVTYEFEVYADQPMTTMVVNHLNIAQAQPNTAWTVTAALDDNRWYYWRVRATDGIGYSQWANSRFFVNTENDPPGEFDISSPEDGSEVDSLTPLLEVTNSEDVDEDEIRYNFEVYADPRMDTLVVSKTGGVQGENGSTSWKMEVPQQDNTWYYWRAVAADEHGTAVHTALASFFVNTANDAPADLQIQSSAVGLEIDQQERDLTIVNAVDVDGDDLLYYFELDTVNTFDGQFLRNSGLIEEGEGVTRWLITDLADNTTYFWRVKASDGYADSQWVQGHIFVNTTNDTPSVPTLKNPGQKAWVDTLTPTLKLYPASDIDLDYLTYQFELYTETAYTGPVLTVETDEPGWPISPDLSDNSWYFWRARAVDEHGAMSNWMQMASFFVNNNGVDDIPEITVVEPSKDRVTNADSLMLRWQDSDPDSNAVIDIYYGTEASGLNGTLIISDLSEDPDGGADTYSWDISDRADGTYYIYAEITDSTNSVAAYATSKINIDHSPPVVTALPSGGLSHRPQRIVLLAGEPARIYYTLDGSLPTIDSQRYSTPIGLDESAELNFMAIDDAGNQCEAETEIYDIILIKGDLDFDGDVDADDQKIIRGAVGTCQEDPAFVPQADTDGDGCIRWIKDYFLWFLYFWDFRQGQFCSPYESGDLDFDGDLDGDDLRIIRDAIGTCQGDIEFLPTADYNGDGCIRWQDDYTRWVRYRVYYPLCEGLLE